MPAKLFRPYSLQNRPLTWPYRSWGDFLAPVTPKLWKHWFSCSKTNKSWWSRPHFGTYCSSLCGPTLQLGRPPRLCVRLLPLTGPVRRCFVLCTFSKGADKLPIRTDNSCPKRSYCAACHCSTTGDVALDAFDSKLVLFGHLFSESV